MPGFYLPSENEFDPSTDDFVLPVVSKERKYKHFDLPLRESEREHVIDFSLEDQGSGNSRYINLGDWIRYHTYAVFDGDRLSLLADEPAMEEKIIRK